MTDTRRLTIDIDVKSGELTRVNNQLLETEKRGNAAAKSMVGLGVGYLAVSQALRDVVNMARPVLDFYKENIRLANEQIKAETNLAAVMRSRGQYSEQNVKGVIDYATALQRQVGASDDATIAAAAQIGAMSKLSGEHYPQAAQAAFQLSKVLKLDLDSAAKLVGKTLESKTNSMARYGIQIDTNGTQLEKLQQILKGTEAGMAIARAEVDTLEGATGLLNAAWMDYRETLGMYLSDNPFLVEALKTLSGGLDIVTSNMQDGQKEGQGFIEVLRQIGLTAIDVGGVLNRVSFMAQDLGAWRDLRTVQAEALGNQAGNYGMPQAYQDYYIQGYSQKVQEAEDKRAGIKSNYDEVDKFLREGRQRIMEMEYVPGAGALAGGIGAGSGGGGIGGGAAKKGRGGIGPIGLDNNWSMYTPDMLELMQYFTDLNIAGGAGRAFAGATGPAAAIARFGRQRLIGGMGMSGNISGGWGDSFNPFGMASAGVGRTQRAGGIADSIFGGVTGTAAGLNPLQTPWYMGAGAQRWGGVLGGLAGGGLQGGLSAAGGIFGSMLGPLGGLAGGWLGNKLGGLFGGGGKKRPDAGTTPAQPIYTSDVNLTNLLTEFLNVTRALALRGAGAGIDAGTAGIQAMAGFKGTMPAMR